jgi:hypothetical protein
MTRQAASLLLLHPPLRAPRPLSLACCPRAGAAAPAAGAGRAAARSGSPSRCSRCARAHAARRPRRPRRRIPSPLPHPCPTRAPLPPLLPAQLRPLRDLKMVLLHEMIHADNFLSGIIHDGDGGHGEHFQRKMRAINDSTVPDPQVRAAPGPPGRPLHAPRQALLLTGPAACLPPSAAAPARRLQHHRPPHHDGRGGALPDALVGVRALRPHHQASDEQAAAGGRSSRGRGWRSGWGRGRGRGWRRCVAQRCWPAARRLQHLPAARRAEPLGAHLPAPAGGGLPRLHGPRRRVRRPPVQAPHAHQDLRRPVHQGAPPGPAAAGACCCWWLSRGLLRAGLQRAAALAARPLRPRASRRLCLALQGRLGAGGLASTQ